ncbi:MAG: chromosome partitioning protein ParA [Lachnospiraceae bacterium]|jgi:MinD-like ATPase involved in chromosome partitioning or flagellar assembly|nr:chromosome partitioning protein ParA [Lachnospiraceae bacterium]
MKIKLAILETDQSYLNRMISVFTMKYADKFELYSFNNLETALPALKSAKIDVFLANDLFDIPFSELPERCGFAYFADSADIDMIHGQKAIGKFQKAELIYKQILDIYSEKAGNSLEFRGEHQKTKVILFDSVSGGAGASSMAAACALHFASQQRQVLYLNLEKFGSSDLFFTAEGQFDISDIIYALKSKKANLSVKLESCVKQDLRGVCFYSQSKIALDMLELTCDEITRLISELKMTGSYEYIVVDTNFAMHKNFIEAYLQAADILWVSDGSEISNDKICRAYKALSALEQGAEWSLTDRIAVIYNKFSNKTGKTIENTGIKNIGGAPRYEHANTNQILERLSGMDLFRQIE